MGGRTDDGHLDSFSSEWSAGEMVSTKSDQRLLASEIWSDHSRINV